MPPTYSIIIPAYNEADELPATLAAIRAAMATLDMRGECIVVDNNSSGIPVRRFSVGSLSCRSCRWPSARASSAASGTSDRRKPET